MSPRVRIGFWDKSCTKPLSFPGESHMILMAPSGSGKGTDILIPALLDYSGSSVVIDPKGQNAAVVGPYLAKNGHSVICLNPFHILKDCLASLTHTGFNPMASLDPQSESFGADCDSLAEAIVYHEGEAGSHWTDSARQLVSGVIMMLARNAPPEYRNLIRVYEIISGPRFYQFAKDAVKTGDLMICGRLGRFAAHKAAENKELSGIVSTAITQCNFMGNLAIANSLRPKGLPFRFADLRQKPTAVFLILPTRYLATCAKWFRLVIAAAMADLLQEERGPIRVLAMLDEFAQLGTLKVMSDIMGIGRGYGIQLFPVLQNLTQLEKLYPADFETFMSGAGAQIFFAPRDMKTAKHVSERCGISQVQRRSKSVSVAAWGPKERADDIGVQTGIGLESRPLYHPHEIAEIPGNEMLVFGENIPGVIRAGRKPYWLMQECRGKYSPDPYHPKKKGRWA